MGKISGTQNVDLTELTDIIVVNNGGSGDVYEKGTWFHPKLAIVFARWLAPEFEIWCDEQIEELLKNGKIEAPETDPTGRQKPSL